MIRRGVGVVVALLLASAPRVSIGQAGGPPAGAQVDVLSMLPEAARETLEKKWKKTWTLAQVDPPATACQTAAAAPIVTADFDGDTLADYALAVQTPDGVKLMALLLRGDQYLLFEVDGLGQAQASAFLGVEKRGTKFVNAASSAEDYFSTETLAAHRCGAPSVVYLWTGSGFRRVTIVRP